MPALQLIFPHKSPSFLLYELRTLLSRVDKVPSRWTVPAQQKLLQLMESEGGEGGRWQTKWKAVSFRLFEDSHYRLFFLPQQCREQWVNHLSPDIRREEWTAEEDRQLLHLVEQLGCRWSKISRLMQHRRSEHMVKNRYHALARKQSRLKRENRRAERQAEGPTFRAKITKPPHPVPLAQPQPPTSCRPRQARLKKSEERAEGDEGGEGREGGEREGVEEKERKSGGSQKDVEFTEP